jgi:hypothetical protein
MSSPNSMRSWPTIPMPFPSEQRSPIVITGSPRRPICDGMPALMLAERPDRRAHADLDPLLAEDDGRRERDHRAVAEARNFRSDGDGARSPRRIVPFHARRGSRRPSRVHVVAEHGRTVSL